MEPRQLTKEELLERAELYKNKYIEDRFANYPTGQEWGNAWDKKESGDSSDWDALLQRRNEIRDKFPKQYPPADQLEKYGPITTTDPIEEDDN